MKRLWKRRPKEAIVKIGDLAFADSDEVGEHLLKVAYELENKCKEGSEYIR
jgi:hypothetical protein